MSSGLIYRALYVLVHCVFSLFEWIIGTFQRIGAVFVDFCHEFGDRTRTIYLKTKIAKKNKIPKHLTVLLGKEEPSYKDLANIVSWCIGSEIIFLSFYDYKGNLKKHQDKLKQEVSKKLLPHNHVIWHNSPTSTYKNGYIGQKIHVKLLSQEDGKRNISKVAQSFSRMPQTPAITIESISVALQKDFEFPDPDLGLCCGNQLTFLNYPPWQIRLTEFLCIKSHYRIKYRTFLEQLHIYGNCEQRLGK